MGKSVGENADFAEKNLQNANLKECEKAGETNTKKSHQKVAQNI